MRVYTIRQGMNAQFKRVVEQVSLPLLRQAGTDIVAFRACLDGPHIFTLLRAYRDLAHLGDSQQRFYDSHAWRHGPRQAVLDCIETYTSAVIDIDETLLASLRSSRAQGKGHE